MRPVGAAVLYRYLFDKTVHTTRKFCSLACSCLGKVMHRLVADVNMVYLEEKSPIR